MGDHFFPPGGKGDHSSRRGLDAQFVRTCRLEQDVRSAQTYRSELVARSSRCGPVVHYVLGDRYGLDAQCDRYGLDARKRQNELGVQSSRFGRVVRCVQIFRRALGVRCVPDDQSSRCVLDDLLGLDELDDRLVLVGQIVLVDRRRG